MLTINYLSTDGTIKTVSIGCDGTTNHGGQYVIRNEADKRLIQTYAGASLHQHVYKNVVYHYYDCNTTFVSDGDASSFATDILISPYITITSEEYPTAVEAILDASSVRMQSNRTDGVVSYSFSIKVATPSIWY